MRITMVGNFGLWNKGTMGARALPMAKALVARGHDVCIVIPPWDEASESGHEYVLDGVRIANIKLPPGIPLLWHALLTFSLFRRVWSEPSDVVHVFKPKAYAGMLALLLWALKKLGICRSRLVMDTDDWEGTGGWNEIETFPRPIKWFIGWHERAGLRRCDAVTVASRALELLAWSIGVPRASVRYVPNGAFIEAEKKTIPPGPEANLFVGTTGNRHPHDNVGMEVVSLVPEHPVCEKLKGHPVVLLFTRFFEYRLEKFRDLVRAVSLEMPSVLFLVIGKGLRGEEHKLATMLNDAGLADFVTFVGWIDIKEIPAWLGLADVAVYPMDDTLLNRSKCPMKLIDLMASEIPVVAERVGQVGEYIEQNSSGILVESDDANGFAQAVVALLQDDLARMRLGEGARTRIATRFDWRRVVLEVEAAYGAIGMARAEMAVGATDRRPA